ncbi:MAG TPA: lipid-A-disaccharide synthase [Candidatus Omnitrophota bacterium]|nr:lipid-A-disaccharide synthase [Candidatus Omnitrophota bacterium]
MGQQHKHLIIVAGEASGDMHAAHLVKALKQKDTSLVFSGLGGEKMREAGVDIYYDLTQMAVIGFSEVLKHYNALKKIFNLILQKCITLKPSAVILIDYPGFNLRLAQELKKHNIKVIYYISPQVWAWKKNRVFTIKKCVDAMLVFFQFEKDFYARYGIPAKFIGNPLIDIVKVTRKKENFLSSVNFDPHKLTIGLLPGSRDKEIQNLLPLMLQTALLLEKKFQGIQFLLLKAPTIKKDIIKKYLKKYHLNIKLIENNTYNGIHASDFCLVASGTATLETAILEKPIVIIYKTSLLTWLLAKLFVKIPYIGLVNIVAQKRIVPECIQFQATPQQISQKIESILKDDNKMAFMRKELRDVRLSLGEKNSAEKAALKILKVIA